MAIIASSLIGKVAIEGADKAKGDLHSVGEKAKETESSFKKMREQVARGFEFGTGMQLAQIPGSIFDAAKEQVVDIIKLAMDHQQIMSQTNQVLKSTHDVSKMTADALDELAQKFGKTTQFSADTVQQGENLLLTFTNIGHQVFPQATQAILDVSQAMGQDLKESAIQVGKALGDPLHGFTNLQRIGVTFSDSEKEQIKTMMKHNDIIGAQKVILKELATEFGGSAQAAGKTFGGQLKIAQDRVEELKIKIGTALMPILNEFLQYFEQHMLPRLDDFSNWFQRDGIPRIQDFGQWFMQTGIPALQNFGGMVGTVVGDLVNFVQWMQQGGGAADLVKGSLIGLGGIIATFKVVQLGKDMFSAFQSAIKPAGDLLDMGKKVIGFFQKDFASDFSGVMTGVGKDASTAGMDIANIGNGASDAEAVVATQTGLMDGEIAGVGDAAVTTSGEISGIGAAATGAEGVASGAFGGMLGVIGSVAGAVGGLVLALSTVKDTMQSMSDQGWFKNQWWNNLPNSTKNPVDPRILGRHPNYYNTSPSPVSTDPNYPYGTYYPNPNHPIGTGLHPHASGILNNPMGHWGLVGEQGPEAMYIPKGASILPNGMMPGGVAGGSNQTLILTIDGVQFARIAMPYLTNQTRYAVGSVGW